MPIYTFRTHDGLTIDEMCPMAREGGGPSIGDEWEIEGAKCVRVADSHHLSTEMIQRYPFLSNALPSTTKGCKIVKDPKTGRMKPLITSRSHQNEVCRINSLAYDDS